MKLSDLMKQHFNPPPVVDLESKDLPTSCPLRGGPVPKACRFEQRFFRRMVDQGVLPIKDSCPLLGVCGLVCWWPKKERSGGRKC
jgi:hypothetical protein